MWRKSRVYIFLLLSAVILLTSGFPAYAAESTAGSATVVAAGPGTVDAAGSSAESAAGTAAGSAAVPETLTLTLDSAVSKALGYTHKLDEIDKSLSDMSDQYLDLVDLSKMYQQQIEAMDDFRKLLSRRQNGQKLDALETYQLNYYFNVYGPKPPEIAPVDMFHNYVQKRDFPPYSMNASIDSLKVTREVVRNSISSGVKQIYDGIIEMQEVMGLQQQLYDKMNKQYRQLQSKLEIGTVSELDRYLSEFALRQQKITIDKLARSIDNLELSLKQQTGIPYKQKLTLAPYQNGERMTLDLPYDTYLKNALEKRSEIVNAKRDLQVKQRELDIMKQYIGEIETERISAQQAADSKTISLQQAVNDVTGDISAGYREMVSLKSSVIISMKNEQNAQKQYDLVKLQYDKGLVGVSTLWDVDLNLTQAKIGIKKAMRSYNDSIRKLDQASGIGPGYASLGG